MWRPSGPHPHAGAAALMPCVHTACCGLVKQQSTSPAAPRPCVHLACCGWQAPTAAEHAPPTTSPPNRMQSPGTGELRRVVPYSMPAATARQAVLDAHVWPCERRQAVVSLAQALGADEVGEGEGEGWGQSVSRSVSQCWTRMCGPASAGRQL